MATGTPSIVPCHSGSPGIQGEDNLCDRSVFESHGDGVAVALDVDLNYLACRAIRRDGAPASACVFTLARNPPLALAEHMVDRRRDGGHGARHGAGRRRVLEAAGNSSAMKPVVSRPSRKRGCAMMAARNAML